MPAEASPSSDSSLRLRDIYERNRNFDEFSDSTEGVDETTKQNYSQTEKDYIDSPRGRDNDRVHEAKVVKDEEGKVSEVNAEFLDISTEKYLRDVLDSEAKLEKKKFRLGSWLNDTTGGKIVKGLLKGGTGLALAASSPAFGFFSPAALATGTRMVTDTAGEMIQYFWKEKPLLQKIKNLKRLRMEQVLDVMHIRNLMYQSKKDESIDVNSILPLENGEQLHLNQELEQIINSLAVIEASIRETESGLAHARAWGKGLRFIANTIASAGVLTYHAYTDGISLGMQNFDKGAEAAGVAGPHAVKTFADGTHFLYNTGDTIGSASAFPHSLAAHGNILGEGHILGSNAPWGAIYAAQIGMGAAAMGAGVEVYEASVQRGIEKNPKEDSIFTLRGREHLGNAGHEISHAGRADPEDISENANATIESIKEGMTPGSVWQWSIEGNPKQLVEIVSIEEGKIRFYLLNDEGDHENSTIKEYIGQENIRNGNKIANSVEELKENRSIDETVRAVAKSYGVKIPQEGEKWRPRAGLLNVPKLKLEGVSIDPTRGEIDLLAGETVRIEHLGDKRKTVKVAIYDSKGKPKHEVFVSTESLLRNCEPPKGIISVAASGGVEATGEEEEENIHEEMLNNINERLKNLQIGISQLEKDQIFVINDKWYLIEDINRESGSIVLWRGNLVNQDLPEDKAMKVVRKNIGTMKFQDFEKLLKVRQKPEYKGKWSVPKKEEGGGKDKNKRGGGGGGTK